MTLDFAVQQYELFKMYVQDSEMKLGENNCQYSSNSYKNK